jgi:hypothetical protein
MQARAQNTSKKKTSTDFLSIIAFMPFGFLVFKSVYLQIQLQFQKLNFLLGLA